VIIRFFTHQWRLFGQWVKVVIPEPGNQSIPILTCVFPLIDNFVFFLKVPERATCTHLHINFGLFDFIDDAFEEGWVEVLRVEVLVQFNYLHSIPLWKYIKEAFACIFRHVYISSEVVFCIEYAPFITLDKISSLSLFLSIDAYEECIDFFNDQETGPDNRILVNNIDEIHDIRVFVGQV